MKKTVLSLMSLIFVAAAANAQVVNMANAEFNKETRPAFEMQLDYSKKLVEEAVEKRFKADKQKGKSSNGMMVYAKASYSDMCVDGCDIYTKVDGNGKSATIDIFVMRSNGNFINSGDDEEKCIKKFMLSLSSDVKALDLQYKIEEQSKVYEKAEKEYEKLLDKKASLEKDLKNTENDIQAADKNRKEQKAALEQLQSLKK